jgi:peptidoglycan/LPS O-acetylase OafA/YrhL
MVQPSKIHPSSDETKTDSTTNEVPSLTGLRFVAASTVAVAHSSALLISVSDASPLAWLRLPSGFGMSLFFVLSGFVIHYNYRMSVTEGGILGIGRFIWARFCRLYPLFLFVVAVDVIFGRQLFDYVTEGSPRFLETLSALPYFLTFTQSWFYVPYGDSSLIYVTANNASLSWSISTEWFFYLSYPLIALALLHVRSTRASLFAMIGWSVLWAALASTLDQRSVQIDTWAVSHFGAIAGRKAGYQDSFVRWLNYFSPYLRIGEFVLGCLLAQLYVQLKGRPVTAAERGLGLCLLALGVISVPVVIYLEYSSVSPLIRSLRSNYGLAPSAGLIIFTTARYSSSFARFLNSRPVVALGQASYSIYMLHFLILILVVSITGPTTSLTFWNLVYAAVRFVSCLSVIVLVALGFHAFLEVPSRKFLRGLLSNKATPRERRLAFGILAGPAVVALLAIGVSHLTATAEALSPAAGLRFSLATYGGNCGAVPGNATKSIRKFCNGKESCDYVVDVTLLGDPAGGCSKSFFVEYTCEPEGRRRTKEIPGEAGLGSRLPLSCAPEEIPTPAIAVASATYGPNCGAPPGNWTAPIAKTCNNRQSCSFAVDLTNLPDPAPGCTKSFVTDYQCAPYGPVRTGKLAGEALFGPPLELRCDD